MKQTRKPLTATKQRRTDESGVFVGVSTQPESWWRRNKKYALIGTAAVLLLVGITIVYSLVNNPPSKPTAVYTADLPSDYATMTHDQAARRLLADTGLDLDKLAKSNIKSSMFHDFNAARDAGQALRTIGQYQRSLQAYQAAADKASAQQADVSFYMNYLAAADSAGDTQMYADILQKTEQAIANDKSYSPASKQTQIEQLKQKQHLKELGY